MHVLQQGCVDVEQAEVPEERQQHAHATGDQGRELAQTRIKQRVTGAQTHDHPHRPQHRRTHERSDHQDTAPALLRPLDDAQHEGHGRGGQQHRAHRVQGGVRPGASGNDDSDQHEEDDRRRRDDIEQQPPGTRRQREAAADVAERTADAAHGRPCRHSGAPAGRRDGVQQHGEGVRQHQRRTDSGGRAARQHHRHRRGRRRQHRANGEDAEAGHQDALATEPVTRGARRDHQTREEHHVRVDDPQQLRRRGMQVAGGEHRHSEVDRGHEPDNEHARRAHRREHRPLPAHGHGRD